MTLAPYASHPDPSRGRRFSQAPAPTRTEQQSQVLNAFLLSQLHRHPQVMETTGQVKQVVRDLFCIYLANPHEMGVRVLARHLLEPSDSDGARARKVANYMAGMIGRFAGREHERLTGHRWLA